MAESKTEKKEQEGKPATEAQIRLIKALYEETNYPRQYAAVRLQDMTRELASKHVQYLKEYKVRDQQIRASNNNVPAFDKISHAMLFKLAWNDEERKYFAHKAREFGLGGAMCDLYDEFKKSEAEVRQHVKESGQK